MTWLASFEVKDLLSDEDVDDETAKHLGERVAARLVCDSPFDTETTMDLQSAFNSVTCQDTFNECMDALYDAADEQRVWIK